MDKNLKTGRNLRFWVYFKIYTAIYKAINECAREPMGSQTVQYKPKKKKNRQIFTNRGLQYRPRNSTIQLKGEKTLSMDLKREKECWRAKDRPFLQIKDELKRRNFKAIQQSEN